MSKIISYHVANRHLLADGTNTFRDRVSLRKRMLRWQQELRHFRSLLRLWRWRMRQRRELAQLSDFMLKDIGVSRMDAISEASKPFWKS